MVHRVNIPSFSSVRRRGVARALPWMVAACALATGCALPLEDENLDTGSTNEPLFVATSLVWGQPTSLAPIPVCWENASAGDADERLLVREAVERTWSSASQVVFSGWGACTSASSGIRIRIDDSGPHTKGLGTQLAGKIDGMVLNFSFQNWSTSCQSMRDFCIEAIAVHEFGHALGFAHEQNRSDTPAWCDAEQGSDGDAVIGDWDLESVMNYCNPAWNGNGALSTTDIRGVQQIYGPKLQLDQFGYNTGSGWRVEKHVRTMADVNGDGLDDVVGFGDSGVWVSLSLGDAQLSSHVRWIADYAYNQGWRNEKHVRTMADVDGDDMADVVAFGDSGVYVSLSTGSGFGPKTKWSQDYGYNTGSGWRIEKHVRELVDIDLDGRADVVGFGDSGVWVSRSTGTGFTAPQLWVTSYGYNQGWRIEKHVRYVADVTGDGEPDVVGFGDDGVYVSRSTGASFDAPQLWIAGFGYNAGSWRVEYHPRFLADVDGDGKHDIVGFANSGTYVSRSTGLGFAPMSLWQSIFGYNQGWYVDRHPRLLGDISGDGKADIVGFANGGLHTSLSTGLGFAPVTQRLADMGYVLGGWRVDKHPRLLGDVNGDGKLDIIGFGYNGVYVVLS
ncbi:FG-GAP-like repeat-containing protein [Haliangium ochraceum]|uniref:Peptidase M12A astacin n=1 Tax=Haliangium ochraceum (strain DSM 14365 / JCM 11303 / SMP-2) TaxID=502025 RepID=D0LMG7_HALO1|nr:FG-GAP-like repeat-containing protein [Haliangium ochraceum]ACY18654.1 peptidase M12A astacin [Haliangium ochraceum DSM 14365]